MDRTNDMQGENEPDTESTTQSEAASEQRGFKSVSEPYSFSVGTKQLVRADFSKERAKLTMWQSSLVMIEKGYIVSFTFVSGGEDDVEELIRNLSFATKAQPHK